jgi:hypothetical protein
MIPAFQEKPKKRLTYAEKRKAGLVTQKPRTRLKGVSKKHAVWLAKYHAQIELDDTNQECLRCHIRGDKHSLERHHTHGRSKEKILIYSYCCSICHAWIHANPNKARKEGFLSF